MKKNQFFTLKTLLIIKEDHFYMLLKMLELISNLIHHQKNVFCQSLTFTPGLDIQKALLPFVGSQEQHICFCLAAWIAELSFGKYTMKGDVSRHIMVIDRLWKTLISIILEHIFFQLDMTGKNAFSSLRSCAFKTNSIQDNNFNIKSAFLLLNSEYLNVENVAEI